MVKIILLVLLAEILATIGQILLKKSANSLEPGRLKGGRTYVRLLRDVALKPLLWAGLFSMSVSLVFWLMALAGGQLSLVFPIGSIQYVFILFFAHFLLGEKIDRVKLTGTFLVMLGIVLITLG